MENMKNNPKNFNKWFILKLVAVKFDINPFFYPIVKSFLFTAYFCFIM